jgi:CTP:molybdopterin cytidylyltransferase MocA
MTAPALVILAAGASSRLGEPKALCRLRAAEPATPLGALLAAGAALGSDDPLVVTGADHAAIAAACPAGVETCRNPRWEEGRTGGVRLAARLRPGRDLCLAPVDVPLVSADVFRALAEAWEAAGAPARGWLAPWFGLEGTRRHGHPVLLGRELALELEELAPDAPLRLLRARAAPLLDVQVAEASVLDDLDRPEDLAALRLRAGGAPSGEV